MKPTRAARRPAIAAVALALTLPLALAACGKSAGDTSANGRVTITVANEPKSTPNPAARKQFLDDIKAFEKLHPKVHVKPSEYEWSADTFPARLAGGQLETTFLVPFTEPQKLISRRQVADLTPYLNTVPQLSHLNKQLLAVGQADGKTYGIPTNGYAVGLIYSRKLFTRAGLDPDKPPATWDELRTDARKISALGKGIAGYEMITKDGFGGWFLTMMNTSYGNPMETTSGSTTKANFNTTAGVQALTTLKNLRWTDSAMGHKVLLSMDDVQKLMASGKIGMFMGAGDWLPSVITKYGGNKDDYGMGPMPQGGGNATLTGGSTEMVNPKATPAQVKAALQWIAYEYLRRYTDPKAIAAYYKAQAAAPNPAVGYPVLPLFSGETQQNFIKAREPYVNLPVQNYKPYLDSLNTLSLKPEPQVNAQNVYQILDPVVQKILTTKSADPGAELKKASTQADSVLAQAR